MSTIRRRNNVGNSLSKTLRDYMVPLIGLFLVILLVFSFFSGGEDSELESTIKYENQIPLNISPDSDLTEAYIIYPGENKVLIESDKELYKGEKILVKEGSVSINFLSVGNFKLNKIGELSYSEDGDFYLDSSDLFISSQTDLIINMKYAKVYIKPNSNVSLSQNEMSSSIYLLSGGVEVRNLVGQSSLLAKGEMISITKADASNKEIDLSMNEEQIDEFYKKSDWFILNNGDYYLSLKENDESETSESSSNSTLTTSTFSKLISFDNLIDESYIFSNSIDISGKYIKEEISKITVNGKEASLDSNMKTFKFKNILVGNQENNLVFKVYDDANDLLQKFVYVVYYKSGDSSSSSAFQVTNYDVDGTQFTFTKPSINGTFTTNSTFVTIRGAIYAEGISKVTVNDYSLSSFNGTTWRYHADVNYNNLKDGTNVYVIKYFDINGKLVYTNNYTIIKKAVVNIEKETKTYSDEASVE